MYTAAQVHTYLCAYNIVHACCTVCSTSASDPIYRASSRQAILQSRGVASSGHICSSQIVVISARRNLKSSPVTAAT